MVCEQRLAQYFRAEARLQSASNGSLGAFEQMLVFGFARSVSRSIFEQRLVSFRATAQVESSGHRLGFGYEQSLELDNFERRLDFSPAPSRISSTHHVLGFLGPEGTEVGGRVVFVMYIPLRDARVHAAFSHIKPCLFKQRCIYT